MKTIAYIRRGDLPLWTITLANLLPLWLLCLAILPSSIFEKLIGKFFLRDSNSVGFANYIFDLGNLGDMPIAGEWNGIP